MVCIYFIDDISCSYIMEQLHPSHFAFTFSLHLKIIS